MYNYKSFMTSATFFLLLLRIDKYIANLTQKSRCSLCGGPLHVSNWYRAGFGLIFPCTKDALIRHSFCCASCRKRITPNSLRFMYYKRNTTFAEIIFCALQPQEGRKTQQKLMDLLGINRKALNRLRRWWRQKFGLSIFVKQESSFVSELNSSNNLVHAILTHFKAFWPDNLKKALIRALCFLARYRTDRLWYLHKERGGHSLNVPKNVSLFSMA